MKRSEASRLLDRVRLLLAERVEPAKIEQILERDFHLPPFAQCDGEAHGNAHIDHCSVCAPRWGWVGEKVEIR